MKNTQTVSTKDISRITFTLLLTTIVTTLVGFLFWSFAANLTMGNAEELGKVTTLMALAGFASLISIAGFEPAIILALNRNSNKECYKKTSIGHFLITGFLGGIVAAVLQVAFLIVFPTYDFLASPEYFILGIVSAILASSGAVLDYTSVAINKSKLVAVRNMGQAIGKTLIILPLFFLGITAAFSAILASLIAGTLFTFIVLWLLSGKEIFNGNISYAWKMTKSNLHYHRFTHYGTLLPPALVPLMITALTDTATAAIYTIAFTVVAVLMAIPTILSNAFLAQSIQANDIKLNIFHTIKLFLAISLPIGILVFTNIETLLLFFGKTYIDGKTLTLFLLILLIPEFCHRLLTSFLRVHSRLQPTLVANIIAGISILTLSIILLSFYGVAGIGIAFILSYTLSSGIMFAYVISDRYALQYAMPILQ